MNRPAGNSSGDGARGASSAALKGALLIGLAVIIGVVMLQQVGKSSSASSTTPTTKAKPKTTTTKPKSTTTTPTTANTAPVKTPAQLKVIVLNGGAKSGDAGKMASKLRTAGYTNMGQASDWPKHTQTGNTVLCKSGLDREAVALSQQTALQGSSVKPYPTPPPPTGTFSADCVVVVGA